MVILVGFSLFCLRSPPPYLVKRRTVSKKTSIVSKKDASKGPSKFQSAICQEITDVKYLQKKRPEVDHCEVSLAFRGVCKYCMGRTKLHKGGSTRAGLSRHCHSSLIFLSVLLNVSLCFFLRLLSNFFFRNKILWCAGTTPILEKTLRECRGK